MPVSPGIAFAAVDAGDAAGGFVFGFACAAATNPKRQSTEMRFFKVSFPLILLFHAWPKSATALAAFAQGLDKRRAYPAYKESYTFTMTWKLPTGSAGPGNCFFSRSEARKTGLGLATTRLGGALAKVSVQWSLIVLLGVFARPSGADTFDSVGFQLLLKQVNVPTASHLILPEKRVTVDLAGPLPANAVARITSLTRQIDSYFDALVATYPASTTRLLRQMYYENKNISEQSGLLAQQAVFAHTVITLKEDETNFAVVIDPLLRRSPSLLRLKLIHEIAVHIGQTHQRIHQVGSAGYAKERRTGEFVKFTELTAALVEKRVIDAIPIEIAVADIRLNIDDKTAREALLNDLKFRREATFALYPWLRQRLAYDASTAQGPIGEYEIKRFVNFYETKELNRGLREPAAVK